MKKKNKLFASIIVVNYNNALYLEECLNSLINQSYKPIEIIITINKKNYLSFRFLVTS